MQRQQEFDISGLDPIQVLLGVFKLVMEEYKDIESVYEHLTSQLTYENAKTLYLNTTKQKAWVYASLGASEHLCLKCQITETKLFLQQPTQPKEMMQAILDELRLPLQVEPEQPELKEREEDDDDNLFRLEL